MKQLSGILADIVAARRKRLQDGEFAITWPRRRETDGSVFMESLLKLGPRVIAEIKHRSPSAGQIFDPEPARVYEMAAAYRRGGAAAISVVIEPDFFGGDYLWIDLARRASGLPVIMKDFIFDTQQLDFAVAVGADAVLLICSMLEERELTTLLNEARKRGLAVLVEAHSEPEVLEAARAGAEIIGVNARDLKTFHVDLDAMAALAGKIPPHTLKVAESGIKEPGDVEWLFSAGFTGFLIGESLLRSASPAMRLREMRGEGSTEVKICGLTRLEDLRACEAADVDYAGLNFSPRSSRQISLERGLQLAGEARHTEIAAVFYENSAEEIHAVISELRPDVVQICDPAGKVALDPKPGRYWQTLGIGRDDPAEAEALAPNRLVLDALVSGAGGGTGRAFDWGIVPGMGLRTPVVLAGGLNPQNAGEAIRRVRPVAVDVASGVEVRPGEKDAGKIKAFVRAVRETRTGKESQK